MKSTFNRDLTLDLIKGIGIVLMVVRHARAPYSDFVLLFHMAIFFIASGYLYNRKYSKSLGNVKMFVVKKIRGLWLPYFLFTMLFVLLNNCFIKLNIYTDNPMFLEHEGLEYASLGQVYSIGNMLKSLIRAIWFGTGTQMGGAFWFFRVSFWVQVIYCIIDHIIIRIFKKEMWWIWIQGLISVLFLMGGWYCHVANLSLKGFNTVLTVYCLLWIGNIIKQYNVMQIVESRVPSFVLMLFSFGVLILMKPFGYIALDGNNMENPLYFIVASFSGWCLLWVIAKIFQRINFIGNKMISYISIHAVPIIALHFLAFKIVNAICVLINSMPPYMIASFPVLMYNGAWWILYLFIGIFVPLIITMGCSVLFDATIKLIKHHH